MKKSSPLTAIFERLKKPGKAVLCLHRRPDGDSLGSNLALYHVLKAYGHTVDIYSLDPVPEFLTFLPGHDKVIVKAPSQIHWHDYDTFWALDMSSPDMLGEPVTFPPALDIIAIDHHRTHTKWGKINLVDADAASCTAVLYNFFTENHIIFLKKTAFALLTGLVTDTGFFMHVNTGEPFRIAADLVSKYKLDYQDIVYHIMRQLNSEDIVFLGNALAQMKVNYEKKVTFIPLPYSHSLQGFTESSYLLMTYLQSINGTEFGMLIMEEKPGSFRIQFRSRNRDYDVSALAAKLGGGGHKNAAGATIKADTIDTAITTVFEHI